MQVTASVPFGELANGYVVPGRGSIKVAAGAPVRNQDGDQVGVITRASMERDRIHFTMEITEEGVAQILKGRRA